MATPQIQSNFWHLKALWDAIEEFPDPADRLAYQNQFIGVLSARVSDSDWQAALQSTTEEIRKIVRKGGL